MQRQDDYQVVLAPDPSTLTSMVRAFQKEGWVTSGGHQATVVPEDDGSVEVQWSQSMVKVAE